MKLVKTAIMIVLYCTISSAFAIDTMKPYPSFKTWIVYGNADFASDLMQSTFAINAAGTPYVAYQSDGGGGPLSVMTLKDGTWVPAGPADVSANIGTLSFAINASDSTAMPYVAFTPPGIFTPVTVDHFDGKNWNPVGANSLPMMTDGSGEALGVNNQGTPYLFYGIVSSSPTFALSVLAFNGTVWGSVGNEIILSNGESPDGLSIAFDTQETPFVFYSYNNKLFVLKLIGNTWQQEGTNVPASTDCATNNCSFAVSPNGTPYIAYVAHVYAHPHVIRFNQDTGKWEPLGQLFPPTSKGSWVSGLSISISPQGVPYVAVSAQGDTRKKELFVKSFNAQNNQWVSVANKNISAPEDQYETDVSLLFNPSNGNPCLSYINSSANAMVKTLSQ